MEKRLCEAAIRGSVESLLELIKEDELILDKILVGCFNGKSPLHVAASSGQKRFVEQLLLLKPEIAEVLDSQHRSALHLASAKGHVGIVKALVEASPDMCLTRDLDGRNPVHVAAVKGEVNVLEELVGTKPHAARARVDRGETILHLCVRYNQLKSLELVLKMIKGQDFTNAKDIDGNTILHLAVIDKQFEIIKHVLKNSKIDVNATNASGHTAMDLLFLSQGQSDPEDLDLKIEDFLREAKAKRAKELVQAEWLTKKRDALMVVASLIATMAFQAGVTPPGGVWQDDLNGHRAGEAVMAYNYPRWYPYFLRSNTIGFVASLSTILLLISGLPFKKRAFMWILVLIMWLTVTSMAFCYAFSIVVVTPKKDRQSLSRTIVVAVIAWCSVMAVLLLLHTVRLAASFIEERRSRNDALQRILEFGAGRLRRLQPVNPPNSVKGSRRDV